MSIDIQLKPQFLDSAPDNSTLTHLAIICGALKYCLGSAKTMSFIKLTYIFDKTLNLEANAFSSKITLSSWNIDNDFKKSLIMAESNGFIELLTDKASKEIRISPTDKGDIYLSSVETHQAFVNYLEYLKEIKIPENRFNNLIIRS
ncbi:hypothetical protein EBI01_05905 [Marinomonas rhizomae]|uniref:Winged helix DNA-binding protein n=1 Tax=Marinomonas rhizomae TaxID=491948 RepID=A0A366JBH1_9GAMM|nr:hypothetical protein [Marinomonas rhizomae]RBP84312.1 hypothetical protein DFP80_104215 [Marinomonas rhizomae]RNF74631.1 hypothetical protein EBI01_05905 [Marinomonas rhizomae]